MRTVRRRDWVGEKGINKQEGHRREARLRGLAATCFCRAFISKVSSLIVTRGPILDAQPLTTADTLLSVTDSHVLGHALVRGEVGERDHQMFVLTCNHVSRSCSLFWRELRHNWWPAGYLCCVFVRLNLSQSWIISLAHLQVPTGP